MKQTTIGVMLEELVYGARVSPYIPGSANRTMYPTDAQKAAWAVFSKLPWHTGQEVEPKAEDTDLGKWHRTVAERIGRVLTNRPYRTNATVLETCAAGWPVRWKVTVYWDRPRRNRVLDDPLGVWTLRQFQPGRRGKILARIRTTLGCDWEDLYQHLPDGDVPEGYEVYPDDPGFVTVAAGEDAPIWTFTFRRTRQP